MAFPLATEQRFSEEVTLAAGDASKELVAAAVGVTIVVTTVILTSAVPAAQALYVGDSSGTVKVLSLPASKPDAGGQAAIQLVHGIPLTKGESLIVKPAAAGPAVHVVAEGYLLRA